MAVDAKRNLVIDILALGAYAVVANPVFTGIAVHEWAGLGLVVVFLVHTAAHVDWAVDAVRTAYRDPSWVRRGNLVLDALIVVGFMVATVSGLMVSGTVLQVLGLYAPGYFFWDPLHAIAAKLLLALLVVHVAVHARWIVRMARKGKGDDELD